eukprot:4799980-Heterocapsa_arctica.AAC.1
MAASDGHEEDWDLIHWATLLADGARAAWETDVEKKLRSVQLAVNTKIETCKVFNKRMPKPVVCFSMWTTPICSTKRAQRPPSCRCGAARR